MLDRWGLGAGGTVATFTGTSGADVYVEHYDSMTAGAYVDSIIGNGGADLLAGSVGWDQIFSHTSFSYGYPFVGGVSYDVFADVDTLRGEGGDDYLFAGYGDFVDGGPHNNEGDSLYISFLGAPSGVNADFRLLLSQPSITIGGGVITGIEHVGYLEGSNYDDVLAPIDTIYRRGATIYGRGGNDRIVTSAAFGGDEISGGDGDDDIDTQQNGYGSTVHGDAGNDVIHMPAYSTISRAYGDDGDDRIYAGDYAFGGTGNDYIELSGGSYSRAYGDEGDDVIVITGSSGFAAGGDGADTLTGSAGDDVLTSGGFASVFGNPPPIAPDMALERDRLTGGTGNDIIAIGYGDEVDGGAGIDTISLLSLGGSTSGVTIDLTGITGSGLYTGAGGQISNIEKIEQLIGSDFADTIRVGVQSGQVTIDGGAGDDLIIASTSLVELRGGAGNDTLNGGSDVDALYGGTGIDRMAGNGGNDFYLVEDAGDQVIEAAGGGYDQVTATVSWVLGAGQEVELIRAGINATGNELANLLQGSEGGNYLYGLGGADTLTGNGGNDTLDGGSGDDRLSGGSGDDVYYIDSLADVIDEDTHGIDTVFASISYALADTLEHLTLLDGATSGAGNALANRITGNAQANALSGGGGSDTLSGAGGPDTLTGGDGDDVFIVDNSADQVVEAIGGGTDRVVTTVSWTLLAGQEVETVTAGGLAAVNLTGNELGNQLIGNGAANVLRGLAGADALSGGDGNDTLDGGIGDDQMTGGVGDDDYFVDSTGDNIIENDNGGTDMVFAGVAYTLGQNLDNLTLLDGVASGTGNSLGNRLTGNGAANVLRGLAGADVLSGGDGNDTLDGGIGDDQMTGGLGDDDYFVDSTGDNIIENDNGGTDMVFAGVAYTLGQNLDNLTLLDGITSGTGNSLDNRVTGNANANVLLGLDGADTLNGDGGDDMLSAGAGDDQLIGGTGHDALFGGNGADTLDGGDGNDHLFGQSANGGADAADSLSGGDGSDYLQGNAGNDTLDGGEGSDRINGGANDDLIRGGNGNDTVNGNLGSDIVDGGAGNDSLRGGQGNDSISGGDGNDVVMGDLGVDTLSGGAGVDLFLFGGNAAAFAGAAADRITDFQDGTDHIGVGYAVAVVLTGAAQQDFNAAAILAQQLFDGRAGTGEVAAIQVGADTYLFYSSNNLTAADSAVQLVGVGPTSISTADFL